MPSSPCARRCRPVVFTNGVFDILHRGHVTYLADAKALGACLIVGVNSDASVRMLGKGDDRPINRQEDRAALLAALESVDWVVTFEEKTPVSLIEAVRPDILVKARLWMRCRNRRWCVAGVAGRWRFRSSTIARPLRC